MIIPVLAGAVLLGIAFDMRQGTSTSVDVFDEADIQKNKIIIEKKFTKSQYKVIYDSSDTKNVLHVDGDISLKVMKGQFTLDGAGDYLRKVINREKTVELLITCDFETETETFPTYLKELVKSDGTTWRDVDRNVVGTHYIRSITYGGQLIISYQLIATRSEYMQDILASVDANLELSSGSLSGDVKGKFKKLEKDIEDKATVSIEAFSQPSREPAVITSIEQVFEMIDKFPDDVKRSKGERGSAIRMELVDLSTLRSDMTAYIKNYALDSMLNEAMNKYDDVRNAWKLFKDWKDGVQFWTDDQIKKANDYNERLFEAKDSFETAILALDPTKDSHQFDQAFAKYGKGGDNIPNRYTREFDQLRHYVENKKFVWYPYTKSVSHYVHWGATTCSSATSDPVYTGYAALSPKGYGSGGNFLCLPKDKANLEERKMSPDTVVSAITGLGQVECAFCRLKNATSVMTVPGRATCPGETKLEYLGTVMTAVRAGTAPRMVCLHRNLTQEVHFEEDAKVGQLMPVWMRCDACDEGERDRFVDCVVCSR